ncbi:MAG: glucose-6-phosphate isomerase [Chloroflexi bacterium]|nr:MAG: glucose-6-phosphate isomerase [Chloroflexota bacterium]
MVKTRLTGIDVDFSRAGLKEEIPPDSLPWRRADRFVKAMFRGDRVNASEDRPALHMALRWLNSETCPPPFPEQYLGEIKAERRRMFSFAEEVRQGALKGCTGKTIDTLVNIGVGGSDLGPRLLVDVFREKIPSGLTVEFAASMDGIELARILQRIDPESAIFVIASKSFSTVDTLLNAELALSLYEHKLGIDRRQALSKHFAGVSATRKAMTEMGIPCERQFSLWPWVGGRYSVWSSVGLSATSALGKDAFTEFLAGAHEIDQHVYQTELHETLPAKMAWFTYQHAVKTGIRHHAVLPYDYRLALLPRYLMQLEMESNGKRANLTGAPVEGQTGPAITGDVGTLAQHAFMQHLHQGTDKWAAEFIVIDDFDDEMFNLPKGVLDRLKVSREWTNVNARAQADTLFSFGSTKNSPYHKQVRGDQPNITIHIQSLNERTLGMLLALYEWKTVIFAALCDINPFDQWGVEQGKKLARQYANEGLISLNLKRPETS